VTVVTPWGRSDELRSRRLQPGPGQSREAVERNQRERLFGAMVATVAEHGYERTRVADLLELSGVSRSAFYGLFESKQDCFLATLDAIVALDGTRVVNAYEGSDGSWDQRLAAAFEALIEMIVSSPAAARLYYVETYAAGPEAIEKVEWMGDQFEHLAKQALDQSPQHAGMPRDLLRAVLRGFRRVIQTRLRTGREQDLLVEGPQLIEWALGYHTPPQRLRRPRKPPAPGFAPRPTDPADARERILDAVIELMAGKGYQALTITDIAQAAATSLTTFYAHFEGKDEAVVAALRRSANRTLEVIAPAYQQADDWPNAIAASLYAFFAYLQLEHPFAQFGGVDIHSGSPLVVEVRDQLLTAAQAFLAEGHRQHHEVNPIAGEAIGASVDALLFDQIRLKGAERVYELAPMAAYITLVPFVGVDEACAIANASR
jgi:AcrR family transcriptional regulator